MIFYLAAGLLATLTHVLIYPDSTVPLVGASGAIAGVMGAYLVLFPRTRIRSMIPLGPFVLFRKVSAAWLLGFWGIGTYKRNDEIDIRYEADGRPMVSRINEIIPPS